MSSDQNQPSQTLTIASVHGMHLFAQELASTLKGGEVIALQGQLGAGKTTFVQGLAQALGVSQAVMSPTFALEKQYQTNKGFTLHHFDWYRLEDPEAVAMLGVEELFGQPESVVVIEWPERNPELLPSDTIRIKITYVDEQVRKITINR